jgi:glycosyltransferase involved in cell wall biosynthesis
VSRRRRYDIAFYLPRASTLLAEDALPSEGGAETQVVLLCRALAERGMAVCLVVKDIPGARIPTSIHGFDVVVRPPYVAHGNLLARLREVATIGAYLNRVDAPVCATRMAGPHVGLAGLWTKLARRRFLYSCASLGDFDYDSVLTNRRDRVLYRLGVALADELIAQTREQVHLCERRFGRTPIFIRSVSEPAPQSEKPAEAFIWIGRVEANKRPLEFVELARALPSARFWMVATPAPGTSEGAHLWAQIELAATSLSNLELIPPCPRPRLLELMDAAVAVVSTSEIEGMPNTFLEGWSRGVPALALSHDPDGIIVRHRLGGFAASQRNRLVELARELWDDPRARRECGVWCRAYVRAHHSPEAIAAEWERVLRPAENGSRRHSVAALSLAKLKRSGRPAYWPVLTRVKRRLGGGAA